MTLEEEIRKERVEGLIELKKFTEYEFLSSWWSRLLPWKFWKDFAMDYYTRKTRKKWKRYKFAKLFEDVGKEKQRAEGERPYRRPAK